MHTYTSVTKFLIEADTKDFFFPLLTITFLEIYEEALCQVEGLNFIFLMKLKCERCIVMTQNHIRIN